MTPKEKAEELYNKYADEFNFDDTYRSYREQSKQCALITVDELIVVAKWCGIIDGEIEEDSKEYWIEVKQEIEKL